MNEPVHQLPSLLSPETLLARAAEQLADAYRGVFSPRIAAALLGPIWDAIDTRFRALLSELTTHEETISP